MRRHVRRILQGQAARSHARSVGFTLVAGCLATGGTVARAQQVTLSFSGGFVLPNHYAAGWNPMPPGPVMMGTMSGAVRMPAIQPSWVSSASPGVTTNSTVAWLAGFMTDVTPGGTGVGMYGANLGSNPVAGGGMGLPTPSGSNDYTWPIASGVSTAVPPVVNGHHILQYSSTAGGISGEAGTTVTTQGIFGGLWIMTNTFVPAYVFTPPNPPPPPPPNMPPGIPWPVGFPPINGNPPNGPCESAYLGQQPTPTTIYLTSPVTLGSLFFDSTTSYTIDPIGSGSLTLDCTSAMLHVNSGSHTINAPIHYATDTFVSVFNAQDALTTTATMTAAPGVAIEKIGDGAWTTKNVRASSLIVHRGTVRAIANNSANGTSVVNALAINDGHSAALDLARNHLVVDYATGTPSPFAEVQRLIKAGYHGGDWLGPGITSSDAAAVHAAIVATGSGDVTALGYAEASALLLTTFGGQTVDADAVLVRYTLAGDANLDGLVNFDDLLALAKNYNGTGKGWSEGDFNYDGVVNFDDQLMLAKNYNKFVPQDPAFAPALLAADSPVPEPTSASVLLLGVAGLTLPRRRRRA